MDFLDRVGLRHPVVQAGMGGGIATGELAGEVSASGALGTVGILAPDAFAAELAAARERAGGGPVAANLLAPFVRPGHVRACVEQRAALVVLHGGLGRRWLGALREAGVLTFCTIGRPAQAREALAAGADGLVVQDVRAGGHLMGDQELSALLPLVRELGAFPVLAAGGVADASDVRRLLDLGADAVVSGTRFLLTDESRAHPLYKQRVLTATRTVRTMLFGVGWQLEHRVVPNAATERWTDADGTLPAWVRRAGRMSAPLGRRIPIAAGDRMTALQRVGSPLFGPGAPLVGMPDSVVDRAALYAGESARRIDDVVPAREAVARLTASGPTARG